MSHRFDKIRSSAALCSEAWRAGVTGGGGIEAGVAEWKCEWAVVGAVDNAMEEVEALRGRGAVASLGSCNRRTLLGRLLRPDPP